MNNDMILRVSSLSYKAPGSARLLLDSLSFEISEGELVLIAGPTGSGKTTLLRSIKPEPKLNGTTDGDITVCEKDIRSMSSAEQASLIGYVAQDPETQIVTDRVEAELAFGLESLGVPECEAGLKIAEAASWFGLGELCGQETSKLSGGKKQLLTLASAVAAGPALLLLDEPTSGLDPVAADAFLSAVRRLNREMGITVVIAEHRLADLLPDATRLLVMDGGKLIYNGSPRDGINTLLSLPGTRTEAPAASRIASGLGCAAGSLPVTLAEGKSFLSELPHRSPETKSSEGTPAESALELKEICFRYDKNSRDILSSLSIKLHKGELLSLLGGNGSGKSTLLYTAAGLLKPYSGSVFVYGKKKNAGSSNAKPGEGRIAILPQNIKLLFSGLTVSEELKEYGLTLQAANDLTGFDFSHLGDTCSYDLSGGESHMLGLAMLLSGSPDILLLDEPTGGLDGEAKEQLKKVISELKAAGKAIIAVTHDCEFAAECSDKVALLFAGRISGYGDPKEFFSRAGFYSTAVRRMTSRICDGIITVDDAIRAFFTECTEGEKA